MSDICQHLDVAIIEELRGVMGDDFSLLVDTFVSDSVLRITGIHDAVTADTPESIRRAAHGFKGSASNMGAVHLAALCNELEQLGLAGGSAGAAALADDIAAAYASVEKELTALS